MRDCLAQGLHSWAAGQSVLSAVAEHCRDVCPWGAAVLHERSVPWH